jgi:DNA-binding transcriptional LysR family regulator
VRLAAPPALAVDFLAPMAALVRQRWPGIRLEILASIEHIDLARGGADLAIRTRAPHEPGLASVAHVDVPLGVFAAPEYAARVPSPARLDQLDWITWAFPYEHVAPRPMLERAIDDFTPAFASDDYLVQRAALHAGLGAMILERPLHPRMLGERVRETELVEIDVGFELPAGELHLVCANSMRFVPRVRAMIEMIGELLDF